ncbi:ribokinase [Dyadobacter sp. CY343]|uniref:ribokinase n=1 Tax=Dyadobacter sp. CY343 TaxID=2907299 RepID=UPI001F32AD9E|nr:ribokinase [Dyadobacter sp. CY343]MCE7060843.1 ribokinase [Dyadobacter sp. CY343]
MIYVVGSSNTDMVVKSDKLPAKGETVIGGEFLMNAGGKGANQAVSAARLGGKVCLICKIGNDLFGKQALEQFQRENILTKYIATDHTLPSGIALINVDTEGQNCITVAPGANAALKPEEVSLGMQETGSDDILLVQLEIPLETVRFAINAAHQKRTRVILNPAPAQILPQEIYPYLFAITPNETEAELLTGIRVTSDPTVEQAARILIDKGCKNVIITLGSRGAYLRTSQGGTFITSPSVKATDTTAAGDCFNGALAVAVSEGKPLEQAVAFACEAAAISVTRMGAQSSMPTRREVDELLFS